METRGILKKNNSNNVKTIVSMIFTHQARMRCFVRKTIEPIVDLMQTNEDDDYDDPIRNAIYSRPDYLDDYKKVPSNEGNEYESEVVVGGGKGFKLPRFKNGSVLEYTITKDNITIRLLIDGEVDENKAKYVYYVIPGQEFQDEGAESGRYQVTPFDPINIVNTTYSIPENKKYIFYVVRHGQATHNLLKSVRQKAANVMYGMKDTNLTIAGKEQAQNSGRKMRDLFNTDPSLYPPEYFFSSDLKRTRETMQNFMIGLKIPYVNTPVIVLPCAHEVAFVASGDCDGQQGFTPPENVMTCSLKDETCQKVGDFDVDWNEYSRFYGNSTRSNLCKGCGSRHCRNTDMIQEAINIINEKSLVKFSADTKLSGGKRKKKTMRRNRYKKNKTKKLRSRKKITRSKRNKGSKRDKNSTRHKK